MKMTDEPVELDLMEKMGFKEKCENMNIDETNVKQFVILVQKMTIPLIFELPDQITADWFAYNIMGKKILGKFDSIHVVRIADLSKEELLEKVESEVRENMKKFIKDLDQERFEFVFGRINASKLRQAMYPSWELFCEKYDIPIKVPDNFSLNSDFYEDLDKLIDDYDRRYNQSVHGVVSEQSN